MSAAVGSAGEFYGKLCVGCVAVVVDINIKEERRWIVNGVVSVSLVEIVLVMFLSG